MNKKDKDIKVVLEFIKVFCRENHNNIEKQFDQDLQAQLCSECQDLALYAVKRRQVCPKDPKPACKNCDTPCYAPKYKEKIRQVMKFSGIFLMKRGRLDYLYHYLF